MTRWTTTWMKLSIAAALLALPSPAAAQTAAPEISAEPVPGQLEVMQGTAVKLGGAPPADGPVPASYHWDIVEGEGGTLYNQDQYEVIFQAPKITDEIELFVIKMTVAYPGERPASTTVHIRVHRDPPQQAAQAQKPPQREESIEDIMTDYYRREKAANERTEQRRKASQSQIVAHHTYRGFHGGWGWGGYGGWGWGWGWGWPAYYPVYAPIVVPPPGIDYMPGDGDWGDPVAVPYDDLVTTFPEHIADDYLPQDYPGAEPVPDMGMAGGSPADFIDIPPNAGGGFGEPPGDVGFGGGFDEPMVDPGFVVDDFGW